MVSGEILPHEARLGELTYHRITLAVSSSPSSSFLPFGCAVHLPQLISFCAHPSPLPRGQGQSPLAFPVAQPGKEPGRILLAISHILSLPDHKPFSAKGGSPFLCFRTIMHGVGKLGRGGLRNCSQPFGIASKRKPTASMWLNPRCSRCRMGG